MKWCWPLILGPVLCFYVVTEHSHLDMMALPCQDVWNQHTGLGPVSKYDPVSSHSPFNRLFVNWTVSTILTLKSTNFSSPSEKFDLSHDYNLISLFVHFTFPLTRMVNSQIRTHGDQPVQEAHSSVVCLFEFWCCRGAGVH